MIIPQFDQDIATVQAIEIQHRNGYHISEKDYTQFLDAIIAVNQLYANVKKQYHYDKIKEATK